MKTPHTGTMTADHEGIVQVLETEHRQVEELLEQLAAESDVSEASELVKQIKRELMAHSSAEDRVVYSTIEQNEEMAEDIEHARDEHAAIDEALVQVVEADPGDPDFKHKVEELTRCVQHHVKDEESEILPRAARFIDPDTSRELALLFHKQKQHEIETLDETEPDLIGGDGDGARAAEAGAAEEDMTLEQLRARAAELGIEGRSKMNKAELRRAVRRH
jgi:hemerythrin superfamily protein